MGLRGARECLYAKIEPKLKNILISTCLSFALPLCVRICQTAVLCHSEPHIPHFCFLFFCRGGVKKGILSAVSRAENAKVQSPIPSQRPRMRQFCVDIAPPYNWRNIDAALLREHSVRRYCAYYKGLQICANLTHASTHASNLRKKKLFACAKKNFMARTRTRDF